MDSASACQAGGQIWHLTSAEACMWGKQLATMLAIYTSRGVPPVVNLRECICMLLPSVNKAAYSGFETKRRCHQKSETGVSVAPKMDMCPTKFFLKKTFILLLITTICQCDWTAWVWVDVFMGMGPGPMHPPIDTHGYFGPLDFKSYYVCELTNQGWEQWHHVWMSALLNARYYYTTLAFMFVALQESTWKHELNHS